MSFDAFEARMQFLQLLKKLNASAQSIQKVVGFAVKYGARCGEDLWEVIMDECEKVSWLLSDELASLAPSDHSDRARATVPGVFAGLVVVPSGQRL